VKGLPEQLLEGRAGIEQEWFFRYMLKDEGAIDARDRAVYAAAYSSRGRYSRRGRLVSGIPQDIVDDGTYAKLTMQFLASAVPDIRVSSRPSMPRHPGHGRSGSRAAVISSPRRSGSSARYLGDFLN